MYNFLERGCKALQKVAQSGKLNVKDGYIVCPVCKSKTNQAVRPETKAESLQLWCRTCKTIHLVNIENGQCYVFSRCR